MTILSATYGNEINTSVILEVAGSGPVALDLNNPSHEWYSTYQAWEGETSPFVAPQVDPIAAAEQFIESHFSTARLLQMKVWWDAIPHDVTPKLAATFGWSDSVTRSAVGGNTTFENPPYGFAEIATEAITATT